MKDYKPPISFINRGSNLIRESFKDALDRRLPTEIVNMTITLQFESVGDAEPDISKKKWDPINLSKRQNEWNIITGWDLHTEVYQQLENYIKQGNPIRGVYNVILCSAYGHSTTRVIASYLIKIEDASWNEEMGCHISIA